MIASGVSKNHADLGTAAFRVDVAGHYRALRNPTERHQRGDVITALNGDLNGTTALLAVDALGPYDETTGLMSVSEMAVVLND